MPDELVLQETARWLRYATEDLEATVANLAGPARHSCLLAQHSAEKAIKSIFVFLDLQVPRIHDLDTLRNLLPEGWSVKLQLPALYPLSLWAVQSRYPGNMAEAARGDADRAVALAENVLRCVEDDLRVKGFVC